MTSDVKRPLKVFLCHASGDKPAVRALYRRLVAEGVDVWLDQEKLLPGQDWRLEIPRAVHDADVVVICLSNNSITKEGYVQKEIKFALDSADEKPEGEIFLIPARLEDCVVPERLSRWQWVDLFAEDGFIRLLRSLKLRADKVNAVIEPASYEDEDKERERRLEQLYTEGLAAFYTEDWDRACHRFQTILSEQPNHKNAAEKLAEAERQRNLAKLYAQAIEAYRAEDWQTTIKTLEELSQKAVDYKDVGQLLKNASKQKRLKELYSEARTLHAAQKWDAVLKVFEQISAIDPDYPDADGLLPSAQKEAAELKRLADLDDRYCNAIREMDAGHWYEARRLLEQIHKVQTGFQETEQLLRKVEDEIIKIEEQNKRANQVNVFYEQAHGLLRSKNWRKALDKMEEIQKLDDHFIDKDEIIPKAKVELERDDQEAQKQNQLAAMYADAVWLLKEGKSQEALEKWQEVKAIDPKYPDRQGVQRTAKKKLSKSTMPLLNKSRLRITKWLWMGSVGVVVLAAIIVGVILLSKGEKVITFSPTSVSSANVSATPRTTVVAPTLPLKPGLPYREDFETGWASNWSLDQGWQVALDGSNRVLSGEGFKFAKYEAGSEWADYLVRFRLKLIQGEIYLNYRRTGQPDITAVPSAGYSVTFRRHSLIISKIISSDWIDLCRNDVQFSTGIWHDIEVVASGSDFLVYIDDTLALLCTDANQVRRGTIWFVTAENSKALVDDIEVEIISPTGVYSDLMIYDDFDTPALDGSYDTARWDTCGTAASSRFVQSNGVLSMIHPFDAGVSGFQGAQLCSRKYEITPINKPIFFEARIMIPSGSVGDVTIGAEDFTTHPIFHTICLIKSIYDESNRYRTSLYCYFYNAVKSETVWNSDVKDIEPGTWHTVRIEIQPSINTLRYYIDGQEYELPQPEIDFSQIKWQFGLMVRNSASTDVVGYFDDVKFGTP